MQLDIANIRKEFSITPDKFHFNNAGMAPTTLAFQKKMKEISDAVATDVYWSVPKLLAEYEKAKEIYGKVVNTDKSKIAFTQNLSIAVSFVARGLSWKSGDEILTLDQEYASNSHIWRTVAKEKNLKITLFKSESDLTVNWDHFISQINSKTRVVAISWIQFQTGTEAPLEKISEACQKNDAIFLLDVIQGLGAIPFDMKKSGVDIVCGGSHKWVCGSLGHGFMAFKDDLLLEIDPVIQGSFTYDGEALVKSREINQTAQRFESGNLSFYNSPASAASLAVLMEYGLDKIQNKNKALSKKLTEGLISQGLIVLNDKNTRSSIVTFRHPTKINAIIEALKNEKISFVPRADGIRLSPHAFNEEQEIDHILSVVNKSTHQ